MFDTYFGWIRLSKGYKCPIGLVPCGKSAPPKGLEMGKQPLSGQK